MKKRTKGIILFAFLGGIMVTSGVAVVMPGIKPQEDPSQMTVTGTPADNFPDDQRDQFCGTGEPRSNTFVKEYKIPTVCTQPLALTIDSAGNVWFAQTNTGNVAKFDPVSEEFVEYENSFWPNGARSMMWGMDYAPDDSIWFTDEAFDSIWKFSIPDERYSRIDFPSDGNAFPQRLMIDGSQIIINDLTGNKISFLDPAGIDNQASYASLPSPVNGSLTSGFDVDSKKNLWYTNWIFRQGGVLVKFNQDKFLSTGTVFNNTPLVDTIEVFRLPPEISSPNGLTIDPSDTIWILDTSSSLFFSFDPDSKQFVKYTTSDPPPSTYGNATGIIRSPVTRPYWSSLDDMGRVVFNEQTGNRIAVFDPKTESLVEYLIPSKNPRWADCGDMTDCGLAQVFGFTVAGDRIWFSEWAENNIGFVDTSIPLPFDVSLEPASITLKKGEQEDIMMTITLKNPSVQITPIFGNPNQNVMSVELTPQGDGDTVSVTITARDDAIGGTYKVLVGAQDDEVAISKFLTVKILPSI